MLFGLRTQVDTKVKKNNSKALLERIKTKVAMNRGYLLSILITGWSHRYNHHLTRREPQWPETGRDTLAFYWLAEKQTAYILQGTFPII